MNLIAVLGWQDGFGADTYVYGIFDSIEKARKVVPHTLYDDTEPRWVNISLNEEALNLDWYEATPLFPTKRKRK
jgi:hypothetical protein